MWGIERLTARDNFGGVVDGYYTPVETYIAQHYSQEKIDEALANGYLTQTEHDEILALKTTVPTLNIIE
jgi:hypothetical protein